MGRCADVLIKDQEAGVRMRGKERFLSHFIGGEMGKCVDMQICLQGRRKLYLRSNRDGISIKYADVLMCEYTKRPKRQYANVLIKKIRKLMFMNIKFGKWVLFSWLFMSLSVSNAQLNVMDSLALVDLYEQTDGPNWQNNTNWLDGPVQTWFGITLTPDQTHVAEIFLPSNNLNGEIPTSLTNLNQIQRIILVDNELVWFPNFLFHPTIMEINIVDNRIGFDSFEPYFEFGPPLFSFAFQFQKPIGVPIDTIVGLGSTLCLPNFIGGTANIYQWWHDGGPISDGLILTDGALKLPIQSITQSGEYQIQVTNEIVPGVQLFGFQLFVQVAETDSLGGWIKPRQLIVKFQGGIHPDTSANIRNEFLALKLDSILCKDIELWGLPDTVFLPGGDTLIEIEEIKSRAAAKSKVEEVDFNHIIENVDGINTLDLGPENKKYISSPWSKSPEENSVLIVSDTIVVAVVDTGIDTLHATLANHLWKNTGEEYNGLDQDGNCIPDDVRGYNFENGTPHIIDDNGHGTHVAGIILQLEGAGNHVSLMSMRTHDDKGRGDIFAMMSAVFYAGSKGARVINISSGYYGEASAILEIAIREAAEVSQSVVVTSAGNSARNNDTIPHYPSNYRLPNLISVAALNASLDSLAFYTNFGHNTVDLAAPGTQIMSTLPDNMMGEKSGSSMAAAWVSGLLANVILDEPDLTAEQILNCTKMNVDSLAGAHLKLTTGGKINAANATTCLNAIVPAIRLKIWLEGPYVADSLKMNTSLINQSLFPDTEPFSALGWPLTEGAGETYDSNGLSNLPVEWAIFELRDAIDSSMMIYQRPVIVQSNGYVVLPSGDSSLVFGGAAIDSYYVALRFLRHLDVLTSSTVHYNRTQPIIDATLTGLPISAFNIFKDINGRAVLLTGDSNGDHIIDASDRADAWNHRNQIGYITFDVNLDGIVDAADRSIIWNNRNKIANFPP